MCSSGVVGDPVVALRVAVQRVCAIDVAALPATQSLDLARELSTALARVTGTRLVALTAVERSGAWALDGSRSMPWALARREDAGIGTVRAELALADRLSECLPLTAAALRAGALNLDKVKLLARLAPTSNARRAALSDPETGEAFLLGKAQDLDLWSLTRVIRYWGYRVDPDADDR